MLKKKIFWICIILICLSIIKGVLFEPKNDEEPEVPNDIVSIELKLLNNIYELDAQYRHNISAKYKNYSAKYKDFKWLSSNPDILEVTMPNAYCGYIQGELVLKKTGIVEIICQTADGKVKSDPVLIKVVKDKNAKNDNSSVHAISKLELSKTEDIWMKTSEKYNEVSIYVNCVSPFKDDNQFVEWVSSEPAVATIEGKEMKYSFQSTSYAEILPKSEGKTTIYAQTKDGKVISNKIVVIVGNQYNPEEVVKSDMREYIISRLKYPTKTEREATGVHQSYFFRSTSIYHSNHVTDSEVTYKQVKIEPSGIISVTGAVKTFTQFSTDIACDFKLQVKYDNTWKTYQVISEQYAVPELIQNTLK